MSMETFVAICGALDAGADELLWGQASPSGAALDIWGSVGKEATEKTDREAEKQADSYAMYVRIMKSVAEIMNQA